jgi:hypothetical protein
MADTGSESGFEVTPDSLKESIVNLSTKLSAMDARLTETYSLAKSFCKADSVSKLSWNPVNLLNTDYLHVGSWNCNRPHYWIHPRVVTTGNKYINSLKIYSITFSRLFRYPLTLLAQLTTWCRCLSVSYLRPRPNQELYQRLMVQYFCRSLQHITFEMTLLLRRLQSFVRYQSRSVSVLRTEPA